MCIDLALQRIPEIEVDNSARHRGLAWDNINDDDRAKYCDISDANLLRRRTPHDSLRCSEEEEEEHLLWQMNVHYTQ